MLLGRDKELGECRALLERAREGHGGALLVHGEPGVGKSSLLAGVAEAAKGFQLLTTQGIESEAPLAFAALHRLLLPVLNRVDRLPEPQANALRVVFGLAEGSGAQSGNERFLVFLAALGLLADAAEEAPVFCLIDDAHWLDDVSSAALLFIARRLQMEPVAMLFAARDGGVRRFHPAELATLHLEGLDHKSAELLLLSSASSEVPAGVREQLLIRAAGNPLALVEIPAALSLAQLEGEAALPAHLPLTDGLEHVFLDRYNRLSEGARSYLLIAATDDSGDVRAVDSAASGLGLGEHNREEAERSALVRVQGVALEMRHPLVRSAIYSAAPGPERRRAHAALAQALAERGNNDRAIWHRAAAVNEPDETIAGQLETVAMRAMAAGGHEASSAALERSAELSPSIPAAARRLHSAAVCAWMDASPNRARTLAQMARARTDDPVLLADIDRLRATAEMNFGSPRVAHGILLRAARDVAHADAGRAREMAMIATTLAVFGVDSGIGIDPLGLLPPVADEANRYDICFGSLLRALNSLVHGDLAGGAAELGRALAVGDGLRSPDLLSIIPLAALQFGYDEDAVRWHGIELAEARQSASPFHILHALTRRLLPDLVTGRWGDVAAGAAEVLDLADATNQPNQRAFPLATLLLLGALRGAEDFDTDLEETERLAAAGPALLDLGTQDFLAWARALHVGSVNPEEALGHLARIAHPQNIRATAVDRLEAAARAGDRKSLEEATQDIAAFAAGTGVRWAAAAAEHGLALMADGAEAEAHFEKALEHHAAATRPFNRARTELAYGEFLRRARRRVDSRDHLRAALLAFEDLGARQWAERAREELRASGESSRRRQESTATALTPQELQVARLVQQGFANREVGARLFVSPRTVDFHLRNVFTKLGISSRGGLLQVNLDSTA